MPSGRNFSTLVEKIIKKVEPKEVMWNVKLVALRAMVIQWSLTEWK